MALGVRITAAAVALSWAVLFFGIDLSVIADPGDFTPVAALEASWGVLFTLFVLERSWLWHGNRGPQSRPPPNS